MTCVSKDRSKFKEDFTINDLQGVDAVLGNTLIYYYGVKIRHKPNVHTMIEGRDEKPKALTFTIMIGLDWIRNNLVTMAKTYKEKFVLILR